MKNIFLVMLSAALLLMISSCADDELGPVLTFDTAGKGAYVKLVEVTSPVDYDLAQFASTKYEYRVEFVDIDNGNTIEKYEVFVAYQDNTPVNGDVTKAPVLLKSFSKSDFSVNENGKPGIAVSITLAESAAALGLTEADMSGADFVNYTAEITTNEGATFSSKNSSAAVNGTAFASHFAWAVKLNCPLSDTQFTGTYVLSYLQGETSPVGGVTVFEDAGTEVEVTKVSATKRQIMLTYIPALGIGNTAVPINFEFVCTVVVPDKAQGSGLRCATGILLDQPKAADLATFDLNDDKTFDLALVEDSTDDCGGGSSFVVMRFTKK